MNKINRIKKLVEQLNYYRNEYYNNSISKISDCEYDNLFDELSQLESETGFIMSASPTQTVGYDVISELEKITHNHPMLSLKKTKDTAEIVSFANGRQLICMEKLDGLTCSLRYVNGNLVSAETRGNGFVGENILHNIYHVKSVPHKIDFLDELVVDGEVICTLDDFQPWSDTYKNPRNFASGSIRLLDSQECAKRNLTFIAWDVIKGFETIEHLNIKLQMLKKYNFKTVAYNTIGTKHETLIKEVIELIQGYAKEDKVPIDGVVFKFNDCKYYESLGATDHHFRGGLAYKFYDEMYETRMIDIEWTMGRTGVLTPVAVFQPVEIDGSTVSRASLHNVSIVRKIFGYIGAFVGQRIDVYKANMIIPQISRAYYPDFAITESNRIRDPEVCPICGQPTEYIYGDTDLLVCSNPNCEAKLINRLDHFCGKKGLDIKGLSKAILETLITNEFIHDFKDIYHLSDYKQQLIRLDGFGQKSVDKLLKSIEDSRNVKLENFIAALGIPMCGQSVSKIISKYCNGNFNFWYNNWFLDYLWLSLDGFGKVAYKNMCDYFKDNEQAIFELAQEMNFICDEISNDNSLEGLKFCITGSFSRSRDDLKKQLEAKGAKFISSVSKNLDVLFYGDKAGSKLTKAQQLGVRVANEEELMTMIN